eukprot:scaffold3054_cov129-Cylindrotheca_fusiformis.AAC.22
MEGVVNPSKKLRHRDCVTGSNILEALTWEYGWTNAAVAQQVGIGMVFDFKLQKDTGSSFTLVDSLNMDTACSTLEFLLLRLSRHRIFFSGSPIKGVSFHFPEMFDPLPNYKPKGHRLD